MAEAIIPIGPQNPSIKEPICVRLEIKGNEIEKANLRWGYVHRGIEKLLEGKNAIQALYIVERICGICEFSHSGAFTSAVEKIMNIDVPLRVKYIRILEGELERLHSHLLWAGFMAHELGFETIFQWFWKERETVLEIFEEISGGRIHHNMMGIGTSRHDITDDQKSFIIHKLKKMVNNVGKFTQYFLTDRIIKDRLKGVGVISGAIAKKFSLVGPVARASGIPQDIRLHCSLPYKDFDFNVVFDEAGDSYARARVRLYEIPESVRIIQQLLEKMPSGEIKPQKPIVVPDGTATGRVEAPRGENFHFLEFKDNKIFRDKIRTPSFATMPILENLLPGTKIGDVPVIIASLDPCFSCLERVMVVKKGREKMLTEEKFRRKYCD